MAREALSGTCICGKKKLCNSASGSEIGLPGRFRSDSDRECIKIGPPAGLRPAGVPILMAPRLESGRNPTRSTASGPEALLRNIGYMDTSGVPGYARVCMGVSGYSRVALGRLGYVDSLSGSLGQPKLSTSTGTPAGGGAGPLSLSCPGPRPAHSRPGRPIYGPLA